MVPRNVSGSIPRACIASTSGGPPVLTLVVSAPLNSPAPTSTRYPDRRRRNPRQIIAVLTSTVPAIAMRNASRLTFASATTPIGIPTTRPAHIRHSTGRSMVPRNWNDMVIAVTDP